MVCRRYGRVRGILSYSLNSSIMHDVIDIIRNVQSLYAVGPTLDVLKDYERVLDELDVYVFKNWEDGELLELSLIHI